ncbi:hypothetical protein GUJ93_ZPchr0011g28352 [Zizania palustris]|uniref:[RNA-polymerase]-subunit kinase n=1 Tax=Zizania palustris TaxID=103762 RepID=A0A8J5WIQ6_ZIZPA|nr:hypothetical protein GUJ93_ZPchr0011g28352 [Zizania palustris]
MNVAPEAVQGWRPRRAESFEKLSKIGQGTYSSVYKARDLRTGKVVALKKHDLVGLIATPGLKFTEPQVKCLMQQLLSGLDHCHSNGVLHRDLKGSNLLIDSNGVLKIADFGLATSYDPKNQQPLTNRVATLWYRPPELLLGATRYGVGVDMWSTGCILAELLAGKPIMPGRTEVEQIHKIFKLCGSPSDEYWQKLDVPKTGMFKPSLRYRRCIADNFKDFPQSALVILEILLALEPDARGTTASTLQSDFFRTKPFACSPSNLPKCPPSKEYDARLRQEEARRQRRAEGSKSVRPGKENPRINHATHGSVQPKKNAYISPKCNSANFNPEDDDPLTLAARVQSPELYSAWNSQGDCTGGRDVPGRKYNSVRVANSTVSMTRSSDLLQPESTEVRTKTHASHKNDLGRKEGQIGNCRIKKRRRHYSGSLITPEGNIGEMLKEHERHIQEAVRKARIDNKSRES